MYHFYFFMSINWIYIIILFIFLINIYIIKNEYKYKKIPNSLLITLLGFNILYVILNSSIIFLIPTLIKLIFLIIWVFLLYFFKIWTPSYLKYIFISSIFFLWNLEITYLSNIFFSILLYIIIYFFYFYLKMILEPKRIKSYIVSLKEKTKWNFHNWAVKIKNI